MFLLRPTCCYADDVVTYARKASRRAGRIAVEKAVARRYRKNDPLGCEGKDFRFKWIPQVRSVGAGFPAEAHVDHLHALAIAEIQSLKESRLRKRTGAVNRLNRQNADILPSNSRYSDTVVC